MEVDAAEPTHDVSFATGLARLARLDLDDERRAFVHVVLVGVTGMIAGLDSISLGVTAPAQAFDARWR